MELRDLPIRRKLMTMILGTSGVVLFLTCAAFLAYEVYSFRRSSVQQLSTLGRIVADNSTAALAFDNPDDATEILAALKAERHIAAAALYDAEGRLFARYPADAPDARFPAAPRTDGYRMLQGHLIGFAPVTQVQGATRLGTLYLDSDLEAIYERLRLYGVIAAIVVVATSLVAYVLSRKLQRQVSGPILALAETAKAVSDRRDYSVRARKLGADELGLLTEAFNHMLERIQQQNADLERRVQARTADLEAANRELEAFCHSVSHDLRMPLRAVSGFAELLRNRPPASLPADVRGHVERIHEGLREMEQLIADLLDFSRYGRQAVVRTTVDLDQLCREVFASLEAERAGRAVELRMQQLPKANADPALLRQVLINLLSNALKYTRPRTPAIIEVGATEEYDEPWPAYYVKDNGVGFDMREAGHLFEVFQRLHTGAQFEGTGVGLATARRIIERHGGRIWAEAEPDRGACFYFTLPPD